MDTNSATAPLTFGDTFTLPVTGDKVWTIKDSRAPFAYLEREGNHTAYAKTEFDDLSASYTPGYGWELVYGTSSVAFNTVAEQLNALEVALDNRTAEEWSEKYRPLLARETYSEVGDIVALAEQWTHSTDIDAQALKAHIAAVAACTAAGLTADAVAPLYDTVYSATLTALRSGA